MKNNVNPLKEKFTNPYLANTLDIFLAPIIFIISKNITILLNTIIISIVAGLILTIYRIYKKQKSIYSLLGILTVFVSGYYVSFIAVWDEFYLTNLFITYLGMFLIFVSLVFRRPLAAYVGHILSGRPLEWFWHKNKKRVYLEVTLLWAFLFIVRLAIIFILAASGDYFNLPWFSIFLSAPFTIAFLTLTYLYGAIRLKNSGRKVYG